MKLFNLFVLGLITSSLQTAHANDAVAQAGEYAKQGMTELASDPPLLLLKNEEGKSRHELSLGYMTLDSDDNDVTLTGGTKAIEKGDAKGYGFSYGYTHSFKDRWAFVTWFQGITVEQGNHSQTVGGRITAKTIDFDALNLNLALGISYEFFRDNPKHTLNVFGGPSFMYLDFHADVENYAFPPNAENLDLSLDFFFSKLVPAVFGGFMYEFKFFDSWNIAPYGMGVVKLIDKCQEWEADRVSVNSSSLDGSSSECTASGSSTKGEIDIAPSFVSIGVKFRYIPWGLGFNVSSFLRNAVMRPDKEDKAEVKGVLFSLSKTWGDGA